MHTRIHIYSCKILGLRDPRHEGAGVRPQAAADRGVVVKDLRSTRADLSYGDLATTSPTILSEKPDVLKIYCQRGEIQCIV